MVDTGPLELRDMCRQCLHNIAFYESGLIYSPAAAKAIAQRVCTKDETSSSALIQQVRLSLFFMCIIVKFGYDIVVSISWL